jgi:hypothetical protein
MAEYFILRESSRLHCPIYKLSSGIDRIFFAIGTLKTQTGSGKFGLISEPCKGIANGRLRFRIYLTVRKIFLTFGAAKNPTSHLPSPRAVGGERPVQTRASMCICLPSYTPNSFVVNTVKYLDLSGDWEIGMIFIFSL